MTNDPYVNLPDDWATYKHADFGSLEKGLEGFLSQIPKARLEKIAKRIAKDKDRGSFGMYKAKPKKKIPWNAPVNKIINLEEEI